MKIDLRCSSQARVGGVVTVGTAASTEAFALVELPLPWPSDVGAHPLLAGVAEALEPLGARVQAIVPATTAVATGEYRVALYLKPPGPFREYRHLERRGPLVDLEATCADLVAEVLADPGLTATTEAAERELLVCTHGSRDRCCGSMGTVAMAGVDVRPDVRLGRTSHLGGHRFAPTAVVLPEGTVWAWAEGEALNAILDRSRPVADLIDRYRGSTAMPSPALQAAEAAVFAEVGWSWLEEERIGEILEEGVDRWTVRIDSTAGSWLVDVVNKGWIAQPVCGSEEPSKKSDPQLEVLSLDRLEP